MGLEECQGEASGAGQRSGAPGGSVAVSVKDRRGEMVDGVASRASGCGVRSTRAMRSFSDCSRRMMSIAVMLACAVATATAQISDSRVVFGGPTSAPTVLARRIQDSLASYNYSDCSEHICLREGRQPRRQEDWMDLGCYCDDACGTYGDCCRDASHVAEEPRPDVHCMPLRQYTGVYVVSGCPSTWPDDEARRMCEANSTGNLLADMLVSNRRTGLTYRNRACAVCHEDTDEAVSWQVRLECPRAVTSLKKKVIQLEDGQWGLTQNINGSEVTHVCRVDAFMPETLTDIVRNCQPLVDSCPASWTDDAVADLCGSYTAKMYDIVVRISGNDTELSAFRNPHCALCNGVANGDTICTNSISSRFAKHREFNTQAFSILLDVSEDSGSNTVGARTVCDQGEFWDQAFIKCRPLFCSDGFELHDNECVEVSDPTPVTPTTGGGGIVFPGEGGPRTGLTEKPEKNFTDFQRCPKIYLSPDEFIMQDDGIVVVEQYQMTFSPGEFELREGELAICSVTSDFRKFDDALTVISLVFLAASIFCLCCHLVLFCLVSDLRNLSGKNLASLCVCLLIGYICFVASPFDTSGSEGCRTLGIVMYTAFIASFFWMNVMAFDVFVTLRQATTELRVSSGRRGKRYLLYLLYVCVMTIAFVAAAVGVDSSTSAEDSPYRPAFGERVCWFSRRRALMVFFAAPLIVVMVTNVALFLGSASLIRRTTQATAAMSCGPTKTNLRLYSRLATITGLSWLVGLVAGWIDFTPLWYAFVILNTLQGVFIFVFFTLADRVRDRIRRDLSRYSRWQAGGKLDPGSDPGASDAGLPCTDSTGLQLTDSRP